VTNLLNPFNPNEYALLSSNVKDMVKDLSEKCPDAVFDGWVGTDCLHFSVNGKVHNFPMFDWDKEWWLQICDWTVFAYEAAGIEPGYYWRHGGKHLPKGLE
jgi:hypothetical protein